MRLRPIKSAFGDRINGPLDYTEIVYHLYCYGVAQKILMAVDRGEYINGEAIAWAKRWRLTKETASSVTIIVEPSTS